MFRPLLLIFFTVSASLAAGCKAPPVETSVRPSTASASPISKEARPTSAPLDQAAGLGVTEVVTANGDPGAELPLVVALHGLGDRGSSYITLFTALPVAVRVVALDGPDASGDGFSWFPRGASLDRAGPGITSAAARVAAAIRALRAARPTRGEPIVTGFSQGGAVSYALALRHPDVVGAAIPIGGWLPRDAWPSPLPQKHPSILGLHGLDDTRVPVDSARELVEQLVRDGYPAELEVEPNVAHAVSRKERTRLFERIVALTANERTP